MSETVHLSTIVRRAPAGYVEQRQELLLRLSGGKVVPKQGWFTKLIAGASATEDWVVSRVLPRGCDVCGQIMRQQLELRNGEFALVDIHYSRVRAIAGRETVLVEAFFGIEADQVQQAFEARLVTMVGEVVAQQVEGSRAGWRGLKHKLGEQVRERVRIELGLDLRLELPPAGRVGRIEHAAAVWRYPLREIDQAQPFQVDLTTDDDPGCLPLYVPDDVRSEEAKLVREALGRVCAGLRLQELIRAPRDAASAFQGEANRALVCLARGVVSLKVEPHADISSHEQRQLKVTLDARTGQIPLCFDLSLLLRRIDADKVRKFELRASSPFDVMVRTRGCEVAERVVAGKTLEAIFLGEALGAAIRDELTRWFEADVGYKVLHAEVELRTARPAAPRRVQLSIPLQVEPIAGKAVDLQIRATARFNDDDEARWLRRNAPDVTVAWEAELRSFTRTSLHTLDEAQAIRSKDDLKRKLVEIFVKLTERDGYKDPALDVKWSTSVPFGERKIHVGSAREFMLGGLGERRVALELRADLVVADEWSYFSWTGPRDQGWAGVLLEQVVEQELSFRTREDLRLQRNATYERIEGVFANEVARRGYKKVRLQVTGLELTAPPKPSRQRVETTAPLLRPDDEAKWSGWLEVALSDEVHWARVGEPDPKVGLSEWAAHAWATTCRATRPGQVDLESESVCRAFEATLAEELAEHGFELVGSEGRIVVSNVPPQSRKLEEVFTCTVGQRKVEVRTTVRLRLESPARWRVAEERDLDAWLKWNARDVIEQILLPMSFGTLLDDVVRVHKGVPAEVSALIESELGDRAYALGYVVEQVLTFPDNEARELLEGFRIELKEKTFDTAWPKGEVPLQVNVLGHFEDFGGAEVNGLLSRGRSVKEWLGERVEHVLVGALLALNPNQIFFRWDDREANYHGTLASQIEELLASYGVVEPKAILTLHAPPYIEKIRAVCGGGPYPLTIVTQARGHHDEHVYEGLFAVGGLDERGANRVFQRTEPLAAAELGHTLARRLAMDLDQRIEHAIRRGERGGGDFGVVVRELRDLATEFCGEKFGLSVDLLSLERRSTELEKGMWTDEREELEHRRSLRAATRGLELKGAHAGTIVQLSMSGGWRTLADGGARDLEIVSEPPRATLIAKPTDVPVPAPTGGYPSCESGCNLDLTVLLRVRSRVGETPPETMLVEAVRTSLREWLGKVEPETFWLRFDEAVGEEPSPAQQARGTVERAVEPFQARFEIETRIEAPSPSLRDALQLLTRGRDLALSMEIAVAGGAVSGTMEMSCSIIGLAPTRWDTFERNHPTREELLDCASRWIAPKLIPMRRRDVRGDLAPVLGDGFRRELAERYGLEARLLSVRVGGVEHEAIAELHRELEELEVTIRKLESRDQSDANIQARLRSQVKRKEQLERELREQGEEDANE